MSDASTWVVDVDERSFQTAVIDRSKEAPVVVDFWAPWCGPCKMLGPLLEKLADEYAGKFLLAKVNIDECQALARQFRVEGIPLVVGIVDGKVVGEFEGMQREPSIRDFLDRLCPSEADMLAKQAAAIEPADPKAAFALYGRALALAPEHSVALAGLAELALDAGDAEQARSFAAKVREGSDGWTRANNVRARLEFQSSSSGAGSMAELRAAAERDPTDLQASLRLGLALAGAGQFVDALEVLVAIVERDREFGAEHAKQPMVQIFNILGPQSEPSNQYRSRLASALY